MPSSQPKPAKPAKVSRLIAGGRVRVAAILPILKRTYPLAKCSLDYRDSLQLLVATILSAQCTDERVNQVTPALFARYRTAADYAAADSAELEREIASTGFFRSKTKSLKGMAARIVAEHGGEVPRTMEALTQLAGVGRKTANVVLGNAFDTNVGVVVDTHVGRLSQRLGLTKEGDPVKIEQDLMLEVPEAEWTLWSHLLIFHGRAICTARKPACERCVLLEYCPSGRIFIKTGESRGE